jgi:cell wall-associated NlpC family hydrolase/phage tail protein X
MNGNGPRWMPLCISASTSALLAASAGSQASASQTHKLKHGESVSAIARKFHVSVHAIAEANPGIDVDSVPDGHKLVIPDVSHSTKAHKTAASTITVASGHHKIAYTRGDHVGLRVGPGESFKRVGACWKGEKLVVSAVKDGWAHVTAASGSSGWMRHDFVKYESGGVAATRIAAHSKKAKKAEALAAAKHRTHAKHLAALAKHSRKHHSVQLAHSDHHSHSTKHHHTSYTVSREHNRGGDSSVVGTAIAYRGTPYRYGSTGGGSFDCSGFTRFVYSRKGVSLPHSAKEQFHQGRSISRGDLKPGDLVFFHTVTSGISHVGIYAGNGKFVHASSRRSGGVRVDRLDSGYYSGAFRGARRVK